MFVSFDRAVVEEYSFGAHGMVNMGEIAAERSAGWEDSSFVVETADDKGGRLHERYALNAAGTELKRSIRLTRKKLPPLEVTQIFDRTD